ncbi:MAG: hypothetical protein EP313_05215 [Bacteroidetes bacterium]|nr:MAG: hypothetical protein EP313_05215 [Bacteroidota bacterium]
MRIVLIITVAFLLLSVRLDGQDHTIMFYNVENLFDTGDDTTRNDEEFLPGGSRRWTNSRYHRKLNAIARAVAAAGEWDLPSVVGLCEVENEEVVRDLAYGTILSAGNYGIVHRDSPDPRGIDLAILYRRDRFRVTGVRSWVPDTAEVYPFTSRNLLYAGLASGNDTIHMVLCHLPSRRGGVLAAEGLRETMIRLVSAKVDSIMKAGEGCTAVMVMGDFNSAPDDHLVSALTDGGVLVNLAAEMAEAGKGSYRYQGMWEMIDQVLVSVPMTDLSTDSCAITGLKPESVEVNGQIPDSAAINDSVQAYYVIPGSFRVFDAEFLLTEDGNYPGLKPFPTYGGYRYAGGYSDHLPVLVKISQRRVSDRKVSNR